MGSSEERTKKDRQLENNIDIQHATLRKEGGEWRGVAQKKKYRSSSK